MPNFFERYTELTNDDLPDPNELSPEDKCALAYQLKMVGESKAAIARYFGISRPTVYAWLKKANDERLQELENKTFKEKYIDRLNELEARRDYHCKIMEDIRKSGETEEIDPVTGEKIRKTTHIKLLSEIARLVRDYDRAIIDLEVLVGHIPKNDIGQLYSTLEDFNPAHDQEDEDIFQMEDEQVTVELLKKLKRKPITLGETVLKSVQDEQVM